MKKFWNRVLTGAIIINIPIWSYLSCENLSCRRSVDYRYSESEIEKIVRAVDNPEEAFYRVSEDLVVGEKTDTLLGCNPGERVLSMRESYSLGHGDCADAALAFKALLSDNPEYDARLYRVALGSDDVWRTGADAGHFLVSYEVEGKLGIVSYNNTLSDVALLSKAKGYLMENSVVYHDVDRYGRKVFNVFSRPVFDSIDEAMMSFNNSFNLGGKIDYAEFMLSDENFKFGENL